MQAHLYLLAMAKIIPPLAVPSNLVNVIPVTPKSAAAHQRSICDFVTANATAGQNKCLPVIQMQQERNLCVPTSASMVLAYYGFSYSPREIKTRASGGIYDLGHSFTDFTMTYFSSLISGLAPLGIHWLENDYPDDEVGFAQGLIAIEAQIDLGHPVLVDTDLSTVGHTFVVAGYSQSERMLFIADPDLSPPGFRQVSFNDFMRFWNSKTVGADVRAAVFTEPPN